MEWQPGERKALRALESSDPLCARCVCALVGRYGIALSFQHRTKTIYTSPIKTLSNQK